MRAMLLWTINDFPTRSSLFGWSGQGYLACPISNEDTPSERVLSKTTYVSHKRFLKKPRKWRRLLKFNGQTDDKDPPRIFTWNEILTQFDRFPTCENAKHPSTLFKNDKCKDTTKARQNLKILAFERSCGSAKTKTRSARILILSIPSHPIIEKKFCQFIKGVKLPDGFGSNFKQKVTDSDSNIIGMKSHDFHIMMQRLLPYGLLQYLDTNVAKPIIELCSFLKQICSQTLIEDDMVKAESQLIDIWFNIKHIYPPAFFDIMIHSIIHLPEEALEGRTILYRWMYPLEIYMNKLKNYVRNKAKPEGSMAEILKALRNGESDMICQHYIDKDPSITDDLFSLACGPSSTLISVSTCVVNGVRLSNGGVIVVEDDHDVIHDNNSSDLALSTSLNDLNFATLNIDGQSMDVETPPYIIGVDDDDDFIDGEDEVPHDLADFNDEVLASDDDDDVVVIVVYSSDEED
ncbi:reverse transcriptase domain-containing protein [Tanacetum coccineum]